MATPKKSPARPDAHNSRNSHNPPAAATSAVIYARISQDRTGAGIGVGDQESDCRALADRLGVTVTDVFSDDDITASKGKHRPGYEAMLAAVEAGEVGMVIVWHNDRLHRNMTELERYIDATKSIPTETVKAGKYDLASATGKMNARIVGAVAVQESELKGERVTARRLYNAERGVFAGGARAYGFTAKAKGIAPEDTVVAEEAEVIKHLAEAAVAGRSLRSLARELNEQGVPTVKGGRWSATQIKDMLVSPRIAGLSVYNGEVVAKAVWPAIVGEDTHRALVQLLTNPARRTCHTVGAGPKYLGSGLFLCGACGAPMRVGNSSGRTHRAYVCSGRSADDGLTHVTRGVPALDLYVEAALVARLQMPGWVVASIDSDDPELAASLTAELDLLRSKKDTLVSLFMADAIDRAQMSTGTKEFNHRAEEITKTLARLGKRSPLKKFENAEVADIPAIWDGLDLDEKRAVLDFSATVTVNKMRRGARFDADAIDVDWKF